jgi:hypothetical protein
MPDIIYLLQHEGAKLDLDKLKHLLATAKESHYRPCRRHNPAKDHYRVLCEGERFR